MKNKMFVLNINFHDIINLDSGRREDCWKDKSDNVFGGNVCAI